MSNSKKVLISLHDVTPYHLERLRKAEAFFRRWEVTDIGYLFIPDYHQKDLHADPTLTSQFKQWLTAPRPFQVEWFLHGYFHLDTGTGMKKGSVTAVEKFKQKRLTADEGEFLLLSAVEIQKRLREGAAMFREFLGKEPDGFVAPAWLFNENLLPALKSMDFRVTEDHSYIYEVQTGQKLRSPVITWATRTHMKKLTSIIGCPLLLKAWHSQPLLRIAVHPFDFDHPGTVKSIEKVITHALNTHQISSYRQLIQPV